MPCKPSKSAFTLVEVLLVVILSGIILTALSFHIFGLSDAYFRSEKNRAIDEHIEGCVHFLESTFGKTQQISSGTPPAQETTFYSDMDARLSHFVFATVPGSSDEDELCLYFRLSNCPLYISGDVPLSNTANYLTCTRDGLIIRYTSSLLPQDDEEPLYYSAVVSPYVTKLEYGYYNTNYQRWTYSEEPYSYMSTIITPAVIHLTFEYAGKTYLRTISLERSYANAPLH